MSKSNKFVVKRPNINPTPDPSNINKETELQETSSEILDTSISNEDVIEEATNQPLKFTNFTQSVKKQLGYRVREEYLEAIKLEAKASESSGEIILDRILGEYFRLNPGKEEFLEVAQKVISITNFRNNK